MIYKLTKKGLKKEKRKNKIKINSMTIELSFMNSPTVKIETQGALPEIGDIVKIKKKTFIVKSVDLSFAWKGEELDATVRMREDTLASRK